VTAPDPAAILGLLDEEQRRVAETVGRPLSVVAGAGTGKTRAITGRIAYGAATGALDPTATLAVTFTTRAAATLRHRLSDLSVTGVQARTFHSAALRQARYFWPRAYGCALPTVADSTFPLAMAALSRLGLSSDTVVARELLAEISWTKQASVLPEDYPATARRANRHVADLAPSAVADLLVAYEREKQAAQVIDFDDVLLCAVALLAEHPQVAAEVRRTYRHFVVDEYQDVTAVQQRLVDLWVAGRHDICVVGDPAQTIHGYAGARSSFLLQFADRQPGAEVVTLTRDYRSTPQVVGCANALMRSHGGLTLTAQRPAGPPVAFVDSGTPHQEASAVATWLADRYEAGRAWGEMAVLYRVHAQAGLLELALAERGIPYRLAGSERFFERAEVAQALRVLGAAAQEDPGAAAVGVTQEKLRSLGWKETPPTAGRAREIWESFQTIADLIAGLAEADPRLTIGAASGELARRAREDDVPLRDGVTLTTLHAAKGLEWEVVAIIGANDGLIPFVRATTKDQIAEERRLLYVGLTRARTDLRISWARTDRGTPRDPSPFLAGLAQAGAGTGEATEGVAASAATSSSADVLASLGLNRSGAAEAVRRPTALATHCSRCGEPLSSAAERNLGHHRDCASEAATALATHLERWRADEARRQGVPAFCIVTDAGLLAVAEASPRDMAALEAIDGLSSRARSRYGSQLIALVDEFAQA
jgi:DNA helicase-2/ATP-dependent DNA helicase PcrA